MGRIIEHDFGKDADEPEKVQEDKAKFDEFLNVFLRSL